MRSSPRRRPSAAGTDAIGHLRVVWRRIGHLRVSGFAGESVISGSSSPCSSLPCLALFSASQGSSTVYVAGGMTIRRRRREE
jgi:hypothetical protein